MLGTRLKLLRNELNLSQDQMANKLNISREALTKYETETRSPSLDLVVKFSEIFNVSTDFLLGVSNVRSSLGKDDIFDRYINDCIIVYDNLITNIRKD